MCGGRLFILLVRLHSFPLFGGSQPRVWVCVNSLWASAQSYLESSIGTGAACTHTTWVFMSPFLLWSNCAVQQWSYFTTNPHSTLGGEKSSVKPMFGEAFESVLLCQGDNRFTDRKGETGERGDNASGGSATRPRICPHFLLAAVRSYKHHYIIHQDSKLYHLEEIL